MTGTTADRPGDDTPLGATDRTTPDHELHDAAPPAARRSPGSRRRAAWAIGGAVGITVVVAGTVALVNQPTAVADARTTCAAGENGAGVLLEDDDHTLVVDMQGEEDTYGTDYVTVMCLLAALDTPARVTSLIESTRSLDGRQDDSWDDFTATWSYHPDSGLDLVVVEN